MSRTINVNIAVRETLDKSMIGLPWIDHTPARGEGEPLITLMKTDNTDKKEGGEGNVILNAGKLLLKLCVKHGVKDLRPEKGFVASDVFTSRPGGGEPRLTRMAHCG
jgi:hypothetical protein